MRELLKRLKFEECNTDKEIINFWDKLGILEGIKNDFKKECVAKAMHTMANKLLNEEKYADNNFPFIDFSYVIFPIIRRVITDPYYKKINDFDVDLFENIIYNSSIEKIINGIGDDLRKEFSGKGIFNKLDEFINLIGNKTFHNITYEDYEEIRAQFIVDAEAELITILCDYYVQKIKEKRTEITQES